jgi:hypothetical protein
MKDKLYDLMRYLSVYGGSVAGGVVGAFIGAAILLILFKVHL